MRLTKTQMARIIVTRCGKLIMAEIMFVHDYEYQLVEQQYRREYGRLSKCQTEMFNKLQNQCKINDNNYFTVLSLNQIKLHFRESSVNVFK